MFPAPSHQRAATLLRLELITGGIHSPPSWHCGCLRGPLLCLAGPHPWPVREEGSCPPCLLINKAKKRLHGPPTHTMTHTHTHSLHKHIISHSNIQTAQMHTDPHITTHIHAHIQLHTSTHPQAHIYIFSIALLHIR